MKQSLRKMRLFVQPSARFVLSSPNKSAMKLVFALISLLLFSLGTTLAQEKGRDGKPSKGPKGSKGGKNHAELFFKHYDANEDGKVTREEFDAGRRVKDLEAEVRDQLFKRLDKNNDGVILKKEVKPPGGEQGRSHQQMREIFDKADLNKDGEITLEEFSTHPRFVDMNEKRRKNFFDHIDRNGDGVINPKDRPEPRPKGGRDLIKAFDLDEDGTLSLAEFKKFPHHSDEPEKELLRRFESFDSNGDGQLDKEELKKGGPHQRPAPDKEKPKRPRK